jgi:hypothetical protein
MVKQGQKYNGKNKDRHTMVKQGQKYNGKNKDKKTMVKTRTDIQW